ncbi:TrkH family potassium uptake protein [Aminipila sp.]|uniref:TrkH family potassium uptake protein n=1 Tax=Aminipila sp. TaxID=2060095 RepID=UPI002899CE88|nr:TrkH family potassium uptake protein [Aminipila sp.]
MSFNYRVIFKIVSIVPIIIGMAMFIPMTTAFYYNEWTEFKVFFIIAVVMIIVSCLLFRYLLRAAGPIRMRDGYLIVTLCGITASVLGALPYLASGQTTSIIDSLFESIASFTTTGSTLFNLDTIPKSLLIWKGVCNWLGGLGILVLTISVLPALGIEGKTLAQVEVPGQILGKITNRASDSAKYLYFLYITFTIIEFALLVAGPMNIFDAMINTMDSVSTSGLGSMNHAFSYYNSFYNEVVIVTFTLLTSVNFTLYFLIIHGNWKTVLTNKELRTFFIIIILGSIFVASNLYFTKTYGFTESIRYGIFQVVSMATTSGFSIIGHADWPAFSIGILILLMMIGGCSFSTSGSLKVVRFLVMCKLVTRGFTRRMHPRSVVAVKIGSHSISALRVSYVTVFIMVYFILLVVGSILLSLQNLDLITTLSSAIAMLSNVGIGLGDVATGNFSIYCRPLRLVLCFLMIAGRLELFTIITLFMPSFWSPDKHRNY